MSAFVIAQDANEVKASFDFQRHAELVQLRLKKFCADSTEEEIEVKKGLALDLKHEGIKAEAAENRASFQIALALSAHSVRDPKKRLFQIDCTFELEYKLESGYEPSRASLEAFMRGNAVFQCWPFAREFVQSATQRMGLSVPPIPMLRLMPKPSASEKLAATPAVQHGRKRVTGGDTRKQNAE